VREESLMKVGLAIAPENALPSAFVVFRDNLETSMAKAARLGYDGVELALLHADQVDPRRIERALADHGLELPVISTGQVFSEGRIWMTHPDPAIRRRAVERIKELIELAAQLKAHVNVGRVRGFVHEGESRQIAEGRFLECLVECADFAAGSAVQLLLEPVNRYEINYINSVSEAVELLGRLDHPQVKVMPDVFHMNIEDASISGSIVDAGDLVGYVHVADSNRWAPGYGHLSFSEILDALDSIGYDWYITAEILPHPDPDTAAASAIGYLRELLATHRRSH
jgi:sugar phosphate isomerase/epimerase